MSRLRFILWGSLFGFVLSRSRATDYDAIAHMFHGTDLHLFGVIGGAVAISIVSLRLAQRWRAGRGQPVVRAPRPITTYGLVGSAVFGLGWGLSGACPGTAMAQLGEGKVLALVTIGGIFAGTWLQARFERWWALRTLDFTPKRQAPVAPVQSRA